MISNYFKFVNLNVDIAIGLGCRQRQETRERLLNYKRNSSCQRCGISDYRLLDFHHVGTKHKGVSQLVSEGYSWKKILAEIQECITLCANCHRLEHLESRNT